MASDAGEKRDLRNLTYEEMQTFVTGLCLPRYPADQLFRWVPGRGVDSLAEMSDLGKALRQKLADGAILGHLTIDAEQISRDGTRKLRLRTWDGRMIESVLIPDGDRPKLTQCV